MSITLVYTTLKGIPAAILRPTGVLDWSCYQTLVAQAWAARADGAQGLIVDLCDVERVGIAGLLGLCAVARLARGGSPFDLEAGWAVIHALVEDRPFDGALAIIHPQPPVRQALARAPFSDILTIHADLESALAALAA
jgi:hypothetical protein